MNRLLARACAPFLERTCAPLTDEQFIMLHSLDRELYARLVLSLHLNVNDSMNVMAFWMWLERENHATALIMTILFRLPLEELYKLAHETQTCLDCVHLEYGNSLEHYDEISLLPNLLSLWFGMMVSLRSLQVRRIEIDRGVDRILRTICFRAFKDIKQQALDENDAMPGVAAGGGTSLKDGWDIQGSPTQPVLGSSLLITAANGIKYVVVFTLLAWLVRILLGF